MFFRKITVLVLCGMCAASLAYAQRSLPMPEDPVKSGTVMLTRTDMRFKAQAEDYLNHGNLDKAVEILKGIRNQWVSNWFLSYAYESNLLYKKALGEVDWLIHQSQRKDLTIELTNRKQRLERQIRDMDQDIAPQPQKKGVLIDH